LSKNPNGWSELTAFQNTNTNITKFQIPTPKEFGSYGPNRSKNVRSVSEKEGPSITENGEIRKDFIGSYSARTNRYWTVELFPTAAVRS
jgi:hypothetical protein